MRQRVVFCLCLVWLLGTTGTVSAELVGHWRLDEATGGQVVDATGRGHDGTINGAAWSVPGWHDRGACLLFDGANDVVEVPDAEDLRFGANAAYTLAAWVNVTALPGHWSGIVTKGRDASNWYGIWINDSNYWVFGHQPNNQIGSAVKAGVWIHVVMVYDNGNKKIYLDGVLDSEATFSASGDNTSVLWFGAAKGVTEYAPAKIDDIRIYNHAVTEDEIQKIMKGTADAPIAYDPDPEDGQDDVPSDIAMAWTPGEFAATHDVYFGTTSADVNDAGRDNPMGVLLSQDRSDATFDPEGSLEYGQTYYWRIDEANAAPDNTIFKGQVWSFTVEPFAYPIANVSATASSFQAGMTPENAVNGSGLNAQDQHSTDLTQMWMTSSMPAWIQFELEKVYKLDRMLVWNSNQMIEGFLGFGAKDVIIEYSEDGVTWAQLANVPEFAKASGTATYTANTTVDFGGVLAKFVKVTITANWGGITPQTGLSEVRFFYVPVQAFEPDPAAGTSGVSVGTDLNWRPGREATSHTLYIDADRTVVEGGLVSGDTVGKHTYTPDDLHFATKYYWRVDEVGGAGVYAGDIWDFTTEEFATIDDFESYTDDVDAQQTIWQTWIDGLTTKASGSQVGYEVSPFAEKTIVHGGAQSMPLIYDNTASPYYSETERSFDSPQDWTAHGADTLSVHFRGIAPAFAETASGSVLMNGIGEDIWNAADQFRFVYKTLTGNGSMVARVSSISNSNAWAKGGVMIRQSVEVGSVHAFTAITPGGSSGGNGASFQRRMTAGSASANDDSATLVSAPYWVKIQRTGDSFSSYISPDGVTWTQLGATQTIPMNGPVLIGLALCSHDATVAAGAEFSDIAATGSVAGAWQVAEIGVDQPEGNSTENVYVTVTDNSGKSKTLVNADAAATARMNWQQWKIPLSEFASAGVKMNVIKAITIGVGNRTSPTAGGSGTIYVDDLAFGVPLP
ncbi:MAG: LamG-like jellyroll fold domain-containing protein [Solirubrobacterales bacterium]